MDWLVTHYPSCFDAFCLEVTAGDRFPGVSRLVVLVDEGHDVISG